LPLHHRLDGGHQRLDGEALEDHAARAGAQRGHRIFRPFARRDDQHDALLGQAFDVGEGRALHLQVEQEHIVGRAFDRREQIVRARQLGDDAHVVFDLEHPARPSRKSAWSSAMTILTVPFIDLDYRPQPIAKATQDRYRGERRGQRRTPGLPCRCRKYYSRGMATEPQHCPTCQTEYIAGHRRVRRLRRAAEPRSARPLHR
jgi:hypothetical protein